VRWVFDDDFDPAGGDPDFQFGGGPVLDLTEGATSLHAGQTVSVPSDVHVYKPDLQLNQQNVVHGDMVSGRFCYNADALPSEGLSYAGADQLVCTEPQHAVESAYARNDFNPNLAAPGPPVSLSSCPPADEAAPNPFPVPGTGTLAGVDDSAFLVRLRRSNASDFDAQTEVASSGPSLPLLFAKGTLIHGDDAASAYSPRRDGLTIRATAISEVRPALHVGLPHGTPLQNGVGPFALIDTFVQTLNAIGTAVEINPANGLICRGLTCAGVTPATSGGRFVDALTDPARTRWRTISTVGQLVPAPVPAACAAARSGAASFGAVYSTMASGSVRIIGFSRLSIGPDPARPADPCAAIVTRGISRVAPGNATGILPDGLPVAVTTSRVELAELMRKNLAGAGAIDYAPVLVPVLAR
jgi:hypothetical protein